MQARAGSMGMRQFDAANRDGIRPKTVKNQIFYEVCQFVNAVNTLFTTLGEWCACRIAVSSL